ncbi:MAG: potassium channel protein [Cyclobacteriaceae bacterium]|nr:potassium channel protein [Cyclobacteriaceae bacterium]
MSPDFKKLIISLSLVTFSVLSGVFGFMFIEGYEFLEAFYMTIITVSTVGYQVSEPLSNVGKIFVSIYIMFNVGIFAYIVTYLASYVFEGEFKNEFYKYFNYKGVMKLKNHVIVCGYGRNGRKACQELTFQGTPFVVIETRKEVIEEYIDVKTIPLLQGDAGNEDILIKANIEHATHLISTLPDDAQNVFIALTAKELKPDIIVISRLSDPKAEKKLKKAGVDEVVMPDTLGGRHMAHLITKPYIIKFLNMIDGIEGGFEVEEFYFEQFKGEFEGKAIQDLHVRTKTGVNILAVGKREGSLQINPEPTTILKNDWYFIVVGRKIDMDQFKEIYIK